MFSLVEGLRVDIELQYRLLSLKSRKVFRAARYVSSVDKGAFLFKLVSIPEEDTQLSVIVTKKIGNAVARNFIRRRLKSAINLAIRDFVPPSYTAIIVIAKRDAKTADFSTIVDSFTSVLFRHNAQSFVK